ncbi:MAG: histidinol dehydrogenase [Deltaproteobacteria bacterium RIFCSPHIGHO2_02_FULL_60_17]|nr:MAG: histidinol dehydrogenase [Deltaproteobacteria bacterium RIFCSPHIGHO2_02_FULL_60_17]
MRIRVIKTSDPAFKPTLRRIIGRRGAKEAQVEKRVAQIIRAVKNGGDRALIRFTRRFDGIRLRESTLEVPQVEIDRAANRISREDLRVLRLAAGRIAAFHRRQLEKSWGYRDALGLFLGQKITPLARVGVYVPGGKASYPSTVLMNVIPAKVAGVKEIIMASPLGLRNDGAAVLAAARIAGVDRIFRVGGAQAISALAFGTESVPKVDKIVGPGNIYVAAAKRMVFGEVDIDSIAGPSEILLLADAHADPSHVAADMLSQAEHDEMAAALCVTPSPLLARRVEAALAGQLRKTRRRAITVKALERYGAIIICRGLAEAVEIANEIAPEHVELVVRRPHRWARAIRNAGAIFLGPYSTPPLGDYMAGPNHVLPTGGSARFFSPLGTYDFVKRTSLIQAGRKGLRALAPEIVHLARLEGLYDHARAVEARFSKGRDYGKKG